MLIFTSRRPGGTGTPSPEGVIFEDLYYSERAGDSWTEPKNIGSPVNTPSHDASVALSADGQTVYLYKDETGAGDIFTSKLNGLKWSEPVNFGRPVNTRYYEPSIFVSADGNLLFFVSDRPGGLGGLDIYYSVKQKDGTWGNPINPGIPINTPMDEDCTFLHPDGKTLYFSSNGMHGMGGYDIYRTELLPEGKFSKPVNIGYPVNTPDNDKYFVLSAKGDHGYYSSMREDGLGGMDIYQIIFRRTKIDSVVIADNEKPKIEQNLVVEEPVHSLTLLKGVITDSATGVPLESQIYVVDNSQNDTISVLNSNSATGKYLVTLPSGKNYGIIVQAKDYLFYSDNFDIPPTQGYAEVEKNIRLKKLAVGSTVILKNIFFDYNKASLRKES
ncbi:MAG: hypothetical protein NZ108_10715, partial [Bacteroidia bacterium]|nr:hypothetical protein [Bacteroidia bacterium]